MTAERFRTVQAPIYVDVLDRRKKPVRIVVVAPLRIPVIDTMRLAIRFEDAWGDRKALYGHAGQLYDWKKWPRPNTPSGKRNYFYQRQLDLGIGPRHAIRQNDVGDWSDAIVGQVGSVELHDYDMRAALPLIEELRRRVAERMLVADGNLLVKTVWPSWWSRPETNHVYLFHAERFDAGFPNEERFGIDRAADAKRYTEAMSGAPATIEGRIEYLDPEMKLRRDLPIFARDVAAWAAETVGEDALELRRDLVVLWHDLHNAGLTPPEGDEAARAVLRDAVEFVDRVTLEGAARLECLQHFLEYWEPARRRIVEIEGVEDPNPGPDAATRPTAGATP